MSARLLRLALALSVALVIPTAWALDRDQAAAQVQKRTGGRVLAVERGERDGRPVFRVRVLTPSGEVRVVVLDAGNGAGAGSSAGGRR